MNTTVKELLSQKDRKFNAKELALLAAYFRSVMFDTLHTSGTGHWGGAASSAELTTCLYFNRLNIKSDDPQWEDRDRVVLSKGHASMNLYTMLAHRGYFAVEELPTFRTLNTRLQGHPCMKTLPGVDMSTGALGHGLSIGLGMALAAKQSGKQFWTYVISGEGCLNEGQSWEALMSAAKFKPEHFVLMIDYNKVQLDGTADEIMPLDPLADKLKSFGWNVAEKAYDGNNTEEVMESFAWMDSDNQWPKAVIYNTVKGKGVSFTEGKNTWHGAVIDDDSYAKGMIELNADIEKKEASL